ncbi:MAG: ankyrin repeat domain-containing protein [Candidatus Thorarchaeota archaeon]|nr:ankyrin repeat domain-containing protein [Candidatus Thorarchaeota archaeon]
MHDIDKELIIAAKEGNLDRLKSALADDADINVASDDCRNTALHLACDNGHLAVVEFLIEQGVDIAAMNCIDMTPLHMAVRNGHAAVVRYICDKALPITERILDDVLTVASMSVYSNEQIYKMVYDYRIKIVRPSPKESSSPDDLLLLSSESGDYAGVVKAVEDGADLNTVDDRGMLPLLWAALRGHLKIVEYLLDNGADIHKRNHAEWTALMEASLEGHIEIVRLLVERGADVNATTFVSGTALMFSAGNGHIEVVQYLLENGADTTIQIDGTEDDDGMTALDYARRFGRWDIARMLENM